MTEKKRGQIIIEVDRETPFTEDERIAMIAALEFLFGERPDPHSDAARRGASPPFGFRMRGMFLQIWGPGTKEEAAGEEMLIRARLEFPIDRTLSPNVYTPEEAGWRHVALEKFREYRDIYEAYDRGEGYGNSSVALGHRETALAQMIPYLLGVPEESFEMSKGRHIHKGKQGFVRPPVGYIKQEYYGEWKNQPGDPHHHEERLPAYPSESLEFTGGGEQLPTLPEAEEELTGLWDTADFTGEQDETRPPVPDAFEHKGMKISPSVRKFMRGAEDEDEEYPV